MTCIATACNDDVFLDGNEMPDNTNATIDGDGGEMSFRIQTKGLLSISIDHSSDDPGFSFHNNKGEQVKESCPASELSHIHYENRWIVYDVTIEGDHLTFHNIENCLVDAFSCTIVFRYDYTVKYINIEILPGDGSKVSNIIYDPEIAASIFPHKTYRSWRLINSSSNATQVEISPYVAIQSVASVETADSWANHTDVKLSLPTIVDSEWILGGEQDIKLASKFYYMSSITVTVVKVDLPANSVTSVNVAVTMSTAKTHGTIEYLNPVSGRKFSTTFTCDVMEPIGYEIATTYEE